jgi:hypothetical protein
MDLHDSPSEANPDNTDTFAVEDVARIIDTVLPMVHRLVLAHPIVQVSPPDADWLLKRQFSGTVCCTLRRGGALVGVCFARRAGAGACDAGMFIEPEARGGLAALRFAVFVEQVMQEHGAAWMLWECEPQSEVLAQRRGLFRFSARYLKLLGAQE